MNDDLKNAKVKLETATGWKYAGKVLSNDGTFLTVLDEKSQHRIIIKLDQIARMEVLE